MNEKTTGDLAVFLENLEYLRQHYGFSKERMSAICGIDKKTWSKIEALILPERLRISVIFHAAWYFRLEPYQLFLPLELENEKGPLV